MGILSQVSIGDTSNNRSPEERTILQVRDLSIYFSRGQRIFGKNIEPIRAVDKVSFDVNESEFLSIVGESGSGKTSVARCIVGIVRPSSGSIKYGGKEVTSLSGKERLRYWKDVRMIFQDPFESLDPRADVFNTIARPIRYLLGINDHASITERVHRILEDVELVPEEVIHRLPHQLSGGQRQRVNIARALASEPKVLIADEPITMLDASQKLKILQLLYSLNKKRRLTVVIITHDLASAKAISDRILVMYAGNVMEAGPTGRVISNYFHPYVEVLINAVQSIGKLDAIDPDESKWIDAPSGSFLGCVFNPRCKYATDICRQVKPDLSERENSHVAACHNPLLQGDQARKGN